MILRKILIKNYLTVLIFFYQKIIFYVSEIKRKKLMPSSGYFISVDHYKLR